MSSKYPVTSEQIARALAQAGGKLILPTDEQRAIIESEEFGSSVIIAGAGSGKTETIAQRVLWLVANGIVEPDQILGLTFTRKAASELTKRIRSRLLQLRQAGLVPKNIDLTVDVATYHSYAGRILAAHGIRAGLDINKEPLGEAAAWQMASKIVNSVESLDYPVEHKPAHITAEVMRLVDDLGEHAKTTDHLRESTQALLALFEGITSGDNEPVRKAQALLHERLALIPLVNQVIQNRIDTGLFTFSDQMSYAAKIATEVPEIGEIERSRFKVVLLDEYQDTSNSQVRFLQALFGDKGHHVTAVGDPNQAIYGWRGASADTLKEFGNQFGAPLTTFHLMTTWRNDRHILELANRVVDVIGDKDVHRLAPRPGAGDGQIGVSLHVTIDDEAGAIAEHFHQLWQQRTNETFAVLVRTKNYIPVIEAALRAKGLKVEVAGTSGLLHTPEIADIVALLRVITFPDDGISMARLLLGPRINLGARDLADLAQFSRLLTKAAGTTQSTKLEEVLERGEATDTDADDFVTGSITDALNRLDEAEGHLFTAVGRERLTEFRTDLQRFRADAHGSIPEIILAAERFLNLDIELILREGNESGRKQIDRFLDEAATFARTGGSLSDFLRWLEAAESEEKGLKSAEVEPSHDAIQILTVHFAKGAEWDVVAVPGLNLNTFPYKKHSDSYLKKSGSLPISLRGDKNAFKDLEFPIGANATRVKDALENFENDWAAVKHREELRLGYVAFTRARKHLFLSASYFKTGVTRLEQSILFNLGYQYSLEHLPEAFTEPSEVPDENPLILNPLETTWPIENPRIQNLQSAARLVLDSQPADLLQLQGPLGADIRALVSEYKNRFMPEEVFLPSRLSVSSLIALNSSPDDFALSIRRPMPRFTDKYAKRGTEFHLWVESRFAQPVLFDDDVFELEPLIDTSLKELQEKWLTSEWADKTPWKIEEGFETVIEGVVLRGRIDAIYKDGDQYTVIDWKTGKAKKGEELAEASIQLAMYRIALSRLHQIPLENIRAGFHYVGDGLTIYRENLPEAGEIQAIIGGLEAR